MAITVTVLGCGEAFDANYPNTSLVVEAGGTILMDCGYNVPPYVWKSVPGPDAIDMIYISHAHADHYFGLPALLGRMWEEGRTKPLVIMSQPPVLQQIRQVLDLGYVGLPSRYQYEVEYKPAQPGVTSQWHDVRFTFAPTRHAVTNLAVRLELDGKSFCYSGDGTVTDETRALFEGADLVIHEAFLFEALPVHADIPGLIRMAEDQQVKQLALIHVQRDLRAHPARIQEEIDKPRAWKLSMPEPGDRFRI